MTRFYRTMIIAGLIGMFWICALLVYLRPPWWTWLVTVVAFLAFEFGCFAWRDREHERNEEISQLIRDMVKRAKPTSPQQKRGDSPAGDN